MLLPFFVLGRCPVVTHSLFADDTLIFLNGRESSLKNTMDFLAKYQKASSQEISPNKSCFLVSSKLVASRMQIIQRITRFSRGKLPFIYLGCPIFKGISKQVYFEDIVKMIIDKVAS